LDEEISRPDPEPIASPSPLDSRNNGFASPKHSPPPVTTHHPSARVTENTQEEIDQANLAQLEESRGLERKRTSELGEAKKRMSALTNKRSVMISARFSGPMQDERLREVTKRLAKVESESLRVQSLLSKETKKHPPGGGQVCFCSLAVSALFLSLSLTAVICCLFWYCSLSALCLYSSVSIHRWLPKDPVS
jgi:hypothetical protein